MQLYKPDPGSTPAPGSVVWGDGKGDLPSHPIPGFPASDPGLTLARRVF